MTKEAGRQTREVLVFPGERLGVIEEFTPGNGTYVENGNIYSSITGQLLIDSAKREAHIRPKTRQPLIPREGDIVVGEVTNVQEKTLTLKIMQIGAAQLSTSFTGIMHISDTSRSYVKTMSDAFKAGDVVRAKVISTKNREFHLSTQNDKLGVIQAFCIHCGNPLTLQRNRLRCTVCNSFDKRKLAIDYEGSDFQPVKTPTSEVDLG